MPRDRRNEIFLAHLPEDVASIFNEVQLSSTNHNKNCVNLFKLHDQAREIYNITQGGGKKVTGERAFQKEILNGIFKTLPVKKGDVCADRVGRFVGAYLKHVNEKGLFHSSASRTQAQSLTTAKQPTKTTWLGSSKGKSTSNPTTMGFALPKGS